MNESSDSVSSDSESEDEEADIAHGPTLGTATQRPFAVRDFPRGLNHGNEAEHGRLPDTRARLIEARRYYWEMVLSMSPLVRTGGFMRRWFVRKKSKKSDKDDGPFEPRGPPSDSR
ncbi:hypothetical protein Tco_1372638 [Tanacetum coccineum]